MYIYICIYIYMCVCVCGANIQERRLAMSLGSRSEVSSQRSRRSNARASAYSSGSAGSSLYTPSDTGRRKKSIPSQKGPRLAAKTYEMPREMPVYTRHKEGSMLSYGMCNDGRPTFFFFLSSLVRFC